MYVYEWWCSRWLTEELACRVEWVVLGYIMKKSVIRPKLPDQRSWLEPGKVPAEQMNRTLRYFPKLPQTMMMLWTIDGLLVLIQLHWVLVIEANSTQDRRYASKKRLFELKYNELNKIESVQCELPSKSVCCLEKASFHWAFNVFISGVTLDCCSSLHKWSWVCFNFCTILSLSADTIVNSFCFSFKFIYQHCLVKISLSTSSSLLSDSWWLK